MQRKKRYRSSKKKSQFRYIKILIMIMIAVGVGLGVRGGLAQETKVLLPETQTPVLAKSVEQVGNGKLIVIDAGHGGIDPGNVADDFYEKDVNLEVALKLQESLEEAGYSVTMTRIDDESLSLSERAELANEIGADLFISIHQNSYIEDSTVRGVEVYYNESQKSVESKEIAELVQSGIVQETGAKDRGARVYNELLVTRETTMPSCLVEMGYMSNPTELALLNSGSYQDKIVAGMVDGINQFFE